jgi:hypothetical protein
LSPESKIRDLEEAHEESTIQKNGALYEPGITPEINIDFVFANKNTGAYFV